MVRLVVVSAFAAIALAVCSSVAEWFDVVVFAVALDLVHIELSTLKSCFWVA